MRLIVFVVILLQFLALSGCATFKPDPWTKEQILLQGVATTLNVIDLGQTLDAAEKPEKYHEINPILGEHPSKSKINKYFACTMPAKIIITWLLPSSWRKYWLGGNIAASVYCVGRNYHVGLRVNY